ncbi:MAG: penicillin-binding transpeptidase domain-containing protein [Solirubrobacterales bacterium]
MTAISSEAERRRRVLTRALPLAIVGTAAFVAGLSFAGGSAEVDLAKRFAAAWADGDYEAMHAELTPAAAGEYRIDDFTAQYAKAAETATVEAIEPGAADDPRSAGEAEVVPIPVSARTAAFGEVSATVEVPVDEGAVAWQPQLVFPGLEPGEALDRRTRAPERAAILAADGTPLAKGPSVARSSPLGTTAIDVAGEMGAPEGEQKTQLRASGFPPGTLVGTNGLEGAFDERLAGTPGGQLLATSGPGAERIIADTDPTPGEPVRTTIEPGLQETTVGALGDLFGGVAVLDATNGSVKALAGIAYSSPQPPGSVFKIITTTAALESGAVSLDDEFEVVTEAAVEGRAISNAGNAPCGGTFTQSFADSCNSVFAPLGAEVGGEKLLATAEDFGFNSPPKLVGPDQTAGIDAPPSTIPDPIGSDLEVAVTAIGQGMVLATPLQMASAAQTIAAGGKRSPTPLVTEPELAPDPAATDVTDSEVAATVRDLMVANVNQGTGIAANIPEAQVAGKTGTAELGPDPDAPAPGPGEDPVLEENAWFTAFAPAEKPKLAIAVMIIDATGSGGEVAAPIAAEILSAAL